MVFVGHGGKLAIKDSHFSENFIPQTRYANLSSSETLMGADVMAQAVSCPDSSSNRSGLPARNTNVLLQDVKFSATMTDMMRENAEDFQAFFYTDAADARVSTVEHPITCINETVYMSQATSMPAADASKAPESERLPSGNDPFLVKMRRVRILCEFYNLTAASSDI